jgi:3-oxoacyl-[acyl-carrier-protein] synthase-3
VLRFNQSAAMDEHFAAAAAEAARACLDAQSARLEDIDLIVAAPARPGYRAALSRLLGVPVEKICVADDHRIHTAALAAAFEPQAEKLAAGARVLFVAAGAGVTAGAALYRQPPRVK